MLGVTAALALAFGAPCAARTSESPRPLLSRRVVRCAAKTCYLLNGSHTLSIPAWAAPNVAHSPALAIGRATAPVMMPFGQGRTRAAIKKTYRKIVPKTAKGPAEPCKLLIARIQVQPGKVRSYTGIAKTADTAVEDSEPGMLHHEFCADPTDDNAFVWAEVFQDDAAILAHLANPAVGTYLEGHAELAAARNGRNDGAGFSVEIYGSVGDEVKEAFAPLGIPVKYFDTTLGYSRIGRLVAGERQRGDPSP